MHSLKLKKLKNKHRFYANINRKSTRWLLMLAKVHLKLKSMAGEREEHYIMIKR